MLKRVTTLLALLVALTANAQFARTYLPSVRTAQVLPNGEWGELPVMHLQGDDWLQFSFDEMSHVYHRYTYRIVHCNADWTQTGLPTNSTFLTLTNSRRSLISSFMAVTTNGSAIGTIVK